MKIRRVSFRNINSLRGQWQIDFTKSPLSDAGLFAITGPTGSGKSSILDAITVALYGEVPRYGKRGAEEIMTRHTAESFSEVEFEIRGELYRSKWSIYRARKKADGKLQPVQRELLDVQSNSLYDLKPSEVSAKIEEITGLDRDRFLRSVMLAQGDFAAFLQAPEKERGELLEKITGLEIYSEISKQAFEREKLEKQKVSDLENKIDSSRLLSEEAKNELTQKQHDLQMEIKASIGHIAQLQKQEDWLIKLENLTDEIEETKAEITANKEKQMAFQPQSQRLQKHFDLLPLRGDFQILERQLGQIIQDEKEISVLGESTKKAKIELNQLQNVVQEKQSAVKAAEQKAKHDEPVIEKVKGIDRDIEHQKKIVAERKTTFYKAEMEAKSSTALVQQLVQDFEKLTAQIEENDSYLEQNKAFADIEKDWGVIKESLSRIDALREEYATAKNEYVLYSQDVANLEKQRENVEKSLKETAQQIDLISKKLQALQQKLQDVLSGQTKDQIEIDLRSLTSGGTTLVILQEIVQRFEILQQNGKQTEQAVKKWQAAEENAQRELEKRMHEQEQAQKERQLLQKVVDQNRQIVNLKRERQNLIEGEACPLCGALEHPYASHTPEIGEDDETQKLKMQIELCESLQNSIIKLQNEKTECKTNVQHEQNNLQKAQAELQDLQQNFTRYNAQLGNEFRLEDREAVARAVGKLDADQSGLEARLKSINALETEIQQLQSDENRERQNEIRLSKEIESLDAQIIAKISERKKRENARDEKERQGKNERKKLNDLLKKYDSQTPNQEERDGFEQRMLGAMEKYKQRVELEREMKKQQSVWRAQITAGEKSNAEKQTQCESVQKMLQQEETRLIDLQKERFNLFGDKDPQQVAQANRQAIADATTTLEQAREHHAGKKSEFAKLEDRLASRTENRENLKGAYAKMEPEFLFKLQEKGCESKEAYRAASLSDEEVAGIQKQEKMLDESAARLAGSLEKTQRSFAQEKARKLTDLEKQTLVEKRQEIEAKRSGLEREIGESSERLRQDEQLKNEFASITAKIEEQRAIWQKWRRLSELIGSSDGSKFSRFAQGLTLARLVQLANIHLQKLHDRYAILKKPETDLELEIIDKYQADTVRPMRSLSGGESFLVSLALALGLSDLASRRNRIDSLFIDEGFGTLDADTLETAISTLENLQQSGKSIGIISHVQALKERLTTQIQLRKESGGVSMLEVVDEIVSDQ